MLRLRDEPRHVPSRFGASIAHRASVLLLMLLAGCDDQSLPPGPDEVTAGLTIYENANYLGESALVTRSISNLADFDGPCEHDDSNGSTFHDWNDCVSSIRIAPGWRARAFRDTDYRGDSLEITGDVPNLQLVAGDCSHDGLNDCISSIRMTDRP